MSDSVRPHRWQPTRLPHPWDSPGKNTGVGAISFSNAWRWKVKVKSLSRVRLWATPWTAAYRAPRSMGFYRHSTVVGCHCLRLKESKTSSTERLMDKYFILTFTLILISHLFLINGLLISLKKKIHLKGLLHTPTVHPRTYQHPCPNSLAILCYHRWALQASNQVTSTNCQPNSNLFTRS